MIGRRALLVNRCPVRQTFKVSRPRNAPVHCRRHLSIVAAGSAAFELPSQQEVRKKAAARIKHQVPRPAQLPPPPKSTSLWHVLPYLTKLAVSDAQLYWRLGLAFALMIASKAAGQTSIDATALDEYLSACIKPVDQLIVCNSKENSCMAELL